MECAVSFAYDIFFKSFLDGTTICISNNEVNISFVESTFGKIRESMLLLVGQIVEDGEQLEVTGEFGICKQVVWLDLFDHHDNMAWNTFQVPAFYPIPAFFISGYRELCSLINASSGSINSMVESRSEVMDDLSDPGAVFKRYGLDIGSCDDVVANIFTRTFFDVSANFIRANRTVRFSPFLEGIELVS